PEQRVSGQQHMIVGRPDPVGRRDDVVAGEGEIDAGQKRPRRKHQESEKPWADERIAHEVFLFHVFPCLAGSQRRPRFRAAILYAAVLARSRKNPSLVSCPAGCRAQQGGEGGGRQESHENFCAARNFSETLLRLLGWKPRASTS